MEFKILKDKKGIELEVLGWWILGVVVLTIIVIGVMILGGKGLNIVEYIKGLFKFGG